MHRINIGKQVLYAENGELLSDVLIRNGIAMEHPCGGKGTCKKCKVTINGNESFSCLYRVTSDITVILPENSAIVSETGITDTNRYTENLCFALDIGTTTLVLALVSLDERKAIRTVTRTNPQRRFGADVISRIDYCTKNGTELLTSCLIDEINDMTSLFNLSRSADMYVSANTTMLHTLFGVDCSSIGFAPYSPVFLDGKNEDGVSIGLKNVARIISLPAVHSFVGADIVAGMNLVGFPEIGKYNLLVDLGTNAEIVLYSRKRALCSSAAAGPCFEGAGISCGMSASEGAISSFTSYGGRFDFNVIGNVPAKGICGTGLIDIISEFLKTEQIDDTGFMEDEEIYITKDVFINQGDVRRIQLAKSAVFSAIHTLLKIEGASFDSIENLYISGGFSAKLNVDSAANIGLLPRELKEKCKPLNNSSLQGTVKFACEHNDLSQYLNIAHYIDLASDKYFSQLFIDNMSF